MAIPSTVNLDKYIEIGLFEDRPHIRGRRILVATVAHSAQTEQSSVQELAYQFTISEAEVLAALLYYEENKAIIESQEKAYQLDFDDTQMRFD